MIHLPFSLEQVWSIVDDALHCAQVHDMRDQVHNLAVANNSIACFIPQGAGVKVTCEISLRVLHSDDQK